MKSIVVSSIVLGFTMAACSGAAPNGGDSPSVSEEQALSDVEFGAYNHIMPLDDGSVPADAAAANAKVCKAGPHLTYYGGPVISSVDVVTVYWGNIAQKDHLNSFFSAITNSVYFDWLSEYNTPTQKIGRGTFGGSFVISPHNTSNNLSDNDIQKEIAFQIANKKIPGNTANTLYMNYFAPSVHITQAGGGKSCVQFCAYHGTMKKGGQNVYYGVVPDLASNGCQNGCGASSVANNTTSVSSHEMTEAVTDAAVGLATGIANPLAWYDATTTINGKDQNGEIGDICNAQQTTVAGFTVQKEWSNKRASCVAQ